MKTENKVFNTVAGVFDTANGRIGPALLKVQLDVFPRRIQRRLVAVSRDSFFFDTPQVSQNQVRTLFNYIR